MSALAERVVIVGLDGGCFSVLEQFRARGVMPHLDHFFRRAAYGELRSTRPTVTPVAWTSFLTGCTPKAHRIIDFHYYDAPQRMIRSVHSGRIARPTLWHYLSDAGRPIVSINLPMTYPPQDVRGLIVSGMDAPNLEQALGRDAALRQAIRHAAPGYSNRVIWKTRPADLAALREGARRTVAAFASRATVAELADRQTDWAALLVQFQNLDSLQHRLWPYLNVDEMGIDDPDWTVEVDRCMRALDDALGRLLELANRRGAAVVVLSDHGFGSCQGRICVNSLLQMAGLQKPERLSTRLGYRATRIADKVRRWKDRHASQAPPLARAPKSLGGCLPLDWRRTLAFAPYGQIAAFVFLNTEGRGPLAPRGSETRAPRTLQETCEYLRDVRHPETSERLFVEVYSVADRFRCDPADEGLPDVIGIPADGFQTQAKWSSGVVPIRPDFRLPGTHRREGILAIDGPGTLPGYRLNADIHDVAPTILAMLGQPVPALMEGRVLNDAFERPLNAAVGRMSLAPDTTAAEFHYTAAEERQIEQRLTQLGYLE